jgi:hypothetical protein
MGAAHKDHWATISLHVGQGHPGGEEFAALFPDLPVSGDPGASRWWSSPLRRVGLVKPMLLTQPP